MSHLSILALLILGEVSFGLTNSTAPPTAPPTAQSTTKPTASPTTTKAPPSLLKTQKSSKEVLRGHFVMCHSHQLITGYQLFRDKSIDGNLERVSELSCGTIINGNLTKSNCMVTKTAEEGQVDCPSGQLPTFLCNTALFRERFFCGKEQGNMDTDCCNYAVDGKAIGYTEQCQMIYGDIDEQLTCAHGDVAVGHCGSKSLDKPACEDKEGKKHYYAIKCCMLQL